MLAIWALGDYEIDDATLREIGDATLREIDDTTLREIDDSDETLTVDDDSEIDVMSEVEVMKSEKAKVMTTLQQGRERMLSKRSERQSVSTRVVLKSCSTEMKEETNNAERLVLEVSANLRRAVVEEPLWRQLTSRRDNHCR